MGQTGPVWAGEPKPALNQFIQLGRALEAAASWPEFYLFKLATVIKSRTFFISISLPHLPLENSRNFSSLPAISLPRSPAIDPPQSIPAIDPRNRSLQSIPAIDPCNRSLQSIPAIDPHNRWLTPFRSSSLHGSPEVKPSPTLNHFH